jgi:hypothetical protein
MAIRVVTPIGAYFPCFTHRWPSGLGPAGSGADGDGEGTEDADDLGAWQAGIAGAVVSAASSESVAAVGAEDDNGAFEELPALSASAFVENPSPGPSAPRLLSDLRRRGFRRRTPCSRRGILRRCSQRRPRRRSPARAASGRGGCFRMRSGGSAGGALRGLTHGMR